MTSPGSDAHETVTSEDDDKQFGSKDDVLKEAQEIAAGGLWSEENISAPMTWEGEKRKEKMTDDPPRLGGMGRPTEAYAVLLKQFDADTVRALVEVVTYEFMVAQGIPGRSFKTGIASMIAQSDRILQSNLDSRIQKIAPSAGKDEYSRQQIEITNQKLLEVERMMSERNADTIAVMERATDVLASYEAKKRDEEAPGEELLKITLERDQLTAELDKLRGQQAALPAPGTSAPVLKGKKKFSLF